MKKHKHQQQNPYRDPNKEVHSEFETTIGNNFKTVSRETPAKSNKEADTDEPLNEVPGDEYDLINERDIEEEPPKMSTGRKSDNRVPLLIGLLGIFGLISVIRVVRSMS